MTTKFSQFTSGGNLRITDTTVGIRAGTNYQYTNEAMTDSVGNPIITYNMGGVGAVNAFSITNALTGNAPVLGVIGSDTNIGLLILTKGSGVVTIDAPLVLTAVLESIYGGTGVDNPGTWTNAGNVAFVGSHTFAGTLTGNTAVTFPTSGTLATVGGTVASITGTANEITASASTGAITLSIPSTFIFPGTAAVDNGDDFIFYDSTGVGFAAFKAPAATYSSNATYQWPIAAPGSNGYLLSCTTAGILSWAASAGSGTVNSGTANDLAYYATTGAAVSGLASANNGVLITSGVGVPSISSTLPSGITLVAPVLGTPASGTLTNCTGLPVAGGGTGNSTFTAYSVICAGTTATGAFQHVSGTGTTGYVLTATAGALPSWQSPTGGGSGATTLWNYNGGTPAINSSTNVTSITHRSAGRYTINITAAYGTSYYTQVGIGSDSGGTGVSLQTDSASAVPTTSALEISVGIASFADCDFVTGTIT